MNLFLKLILQPLLYLQKKDKKMYGDPSDPRMEYIIMKYIC